MSSVVIEEISALRNGTETECGKAGGKYSYIHPHALEIMEEVSGNVLLKESEDNSQV